MIHEKRSSASRPSDDSPDLTAFDRNGGPKNHETLGHAIRAPENSMPLLTALVKSLSQSAPAPLTLLAANSNLECFPELRANYI
jgi:hypothetical protein